MMVELPDEMVQRWLAGDGRETDDEIILAAIHHAKERVCEHVVITQPALPNLGETLSQNTVAYPYCPKCGEKL